LSIPVLLIHRGCYLDIKATDLTLGLEIVSLGLNNDLFLLRISSIFHEGSSSIETENACSFRMKQKAEESEEYQEADLGISRSLSSVEVFGTERTTECYDVNLQEGCDRRWVPDIPYVTVYWLYSYGNCFHEKV
jgi:hypothetical protein